MALRWYRFRGKIVVQGSECAPVIYQTAGRDLGKGWKGYSIRPVLPCDKITESKLKWILFYPLSEERGPVPFRTLREAKLAAENVLERLALVL